MTQLHDFKDDGTACYANVRMDNGDPCWVSVAQSGILVKKSKLGLFGAKLYDEKNVYHSASTAKALAYLYPKKLTPKDMDHPVLKAIVNATLHCSSLAEVTRILNEAIKDAEAKSGKGIADIILS